jgi:hypothetical protein
VTRAAAAARPSPSDEMTPNRVFKSTAGVPFKGLLLPCHSLHPKRQGMVLFFNLFVSIQPGKCRNISQV